MKVEKTWEGKAQEIERERERERETLWDTVSVIMGDRMSSDRSTWRLTKSSSFHTHARINLTLAICFSCCCCCFLMEFYWALTATHDCFPWTHCGTVQPRVPLFTDNTLFPSQSLTPVPPSGPSFAIRRSGLCCLSPTGYREARNPVVEEGTEEGAREGEESDADTTRPKSEGRPNYCSPR